MLAKKHNVNQMIREDPLGAFLEWVPAELLHAPGVDWDRLPRQAAYYLVRSVGTSPDAAYLVMAAAVAMDALSASSLLSMLWSLHALFRTLRRIYALDDISELHTHNFVAQTPIPNCYRGQLKAYSSVTRKHMPAYLERLSLEERERMSRYALPPLPADVLKQLLATTRQPEEPRALRELHKVQRARAYIEDRCRQNLDVTCEELLKGLRSLEIRMGSKGINSLRTELGLQRPSGSVPQHLRESSVHDQARAWLVKERRRNPDVRAPILLDGLRAHFNIDISTRQLNNILKNLGVARPGPHRSKANRKNVATPAQPGNQSDMRDSEVELQTSPVWSLDGGQHNHDGPTKRPPDAEIIEVEAPGIRHSRHSAASGGRGGL